MKVHYTSNDGRFEVDFEGDVKTVFTDLGSFQEVFESRTCGKCGSTNTHFHTRVVEDNAYFELICMEGQCGYKFDYSQHKKGGTLYPKSRNGKDHGWYKWVPDGTIKPVSK